jgi:H+-transporting ATPase
VAPIGWKMAGFVWAYAIGWFLLTDPVKLLVYHVLDLMSDKDAAATKPKPTQASSRQEALSAPKAVK